MFICGRTKNEWNNDNIYNGRLPLRYYSPWFDNGSKITTIKRYLKITHTKLGQQYYINKYNEEQKYYLFANNIDDNKKFITQYYYENIFKINEIIKKIDENTFSPSVYNGSFLQLNTENIYKFFIIINLIKKHEEIKNEYIIPKNSVLGVDIWSWTDWGKRMMKNIRSNDTNKINNNYYGYHMYTYTKQNYNSYSSYIDTINIEIVKIIDDCTAKIITEILDGTYKDILLEQIIKYN